MNSQSHQHILIIIPAKNEATAIGSVICEIREHFTGTILVVNDASSDDTAQIARKAGAKVLSLALSLGAWGAIQTGLRYALKHSYQIAITMDADGQHEACSIPVLLQGLEQQTCDVIVGAYPERGSLARHIAWAFFRWLSGIALEDLTSGLRAYRHPAIELLASPSATLLDYQDVGVLMLLHKAHLRIGEVPIYMRQRLDGGKSRIFNSWWAVSRYMLHTAILCTAQLQLPKKFQ